jgi:hypothetical protein
MASKFPHVQVIGIDLALVVLNEHVKPDNCRFELGDVNRGLPRFYGQIDLIQMRAACSGVSPRCLSPIHLALSSLLFVTSLKMQSCLKHQINNYVATVGELVKCLKPGGMLILSEGDIEWRKEDQVHLGIPVDSNCPDAIQPGKSWNVKNGHGMCF